VPFPLAALHAAAMLRACPCSVPCPGQPVCLPLARNPDIGARHAGRRIDIQDLMVMALAASSSARRWK